MARSVRRVTVWCQVEVVDELVAVGTVLSATAAVRHPRHRVGLGRVPVCDWRSGAPKTPVVGARRYSALYHARTGAGVGGVFDDRLRRPSERGRSRTSCGRRSGRRSGAFRHDRVADGGVGAEVSPLRRVSGKPITPDRFIPVDRRSNLPRCSRCPHEACACRRSGTLAGIDRSSWGEPLASSSARRPWSTDRRVFEASGRCTRMGFEVTSPGSSPPHGQPTSPQLKASGRTSPSTTSHRTRRGATAGMPVAREVAGFYRAAEPTAEGDRPIGVTSPCMSSLSCVARASRDEQLESSPIGLRVGPASSVAPCRREATGRLSTRP